MYNRYIPRLLGHYVTLSSLLFLFTDLLSLENGVMVLRNALAEIK